MKSCASRKSSQTLLKLAILHSTQGLEIPTGVLPRTRKMAGKLQLIGTAAGNLAALPETFVQDQALPLRDAVKAARELLLLTTFRFPGMSESMDGVSPKPSPSSSTHSSEGSNKMDDDGQSSELDDYQGLIKSAVAIVKTLRLSKDEQRDIGEAALNFVQLVESVARMDLGYM